MLLTYVEVPGIYLDITRRKIKVFDHVECGNVVWKGDGAELEIANPTPYTAVLTVFADGERAPGRVCHNYFPRMEKLTLAPGEQRVFSVSRMQGQCS